jgi:hypothetical protein
MFVVVDLELAAYNRSGNCGFEVCPDLLKDSATLTLNLWNLDVVSERPFRNLVPASQKTHCISHTKVK